MTRVSVVTRKVVTVTTIEVGTYLFRAKNIKYSNFNIFNITMDIRYAFLFVYLTLDVNEYPIIFSKLYKANTVKLYSCISTLHNMNICLNFRK